MLGLYSSHTSLSSFSTMNVQFLTAVLAASITGVIAQAQSASAFSWNNAWTQPTIQSAAQTGFNHLPFQQFVQQEGLKLSTANLAKVDLSKLKLKFDYDVKSYFINEGAGYQNQLAFESTGTTTQSGLLFRDISCSSADNVTGATCQGAWGGDALNFGDRVSTGTIKAGSQLNFWLRANGVHRGNNSYIFGTQDASNPDGLQHAVAYAYKGMIVMGFEDLFGDARVDQKTGKFGEWSDRDFNDTVFVVDIGEDNLRAIQDVPEPGSLAAIGLAASAGISALRRRVLDV
jgi:hypothetical protein